MGYCTTRGYLFLPGEDKKGQRVYALFKCELHLVEGLRANILVGNDILSPEGFVLNAKMGHAVIGSCGVTIPVKAKQRGRQFLKRRLLTKDDGVVPPRSETRIPLLPVPLPDDRDYLFHPATQANMRFLNPAVWQMSLDCANKISFNSK